MVILASYPWESLEHIDRYPEVCFQCGVCCVTRFGCPAQRSPKYSPRSTFVYECLGSDYPAANPHIWECVSCHRCDDLCPFDSSPGRFIDVAKTEAFARGFIQGLIKNSEAEADSEDYEKAVNRFFTSKRVPGGRFMESRDRKVDSVCPYCGVGCRIQLLVREGRVVGVLPGKEGPGEGKLCLKGWSSYEFIHSEARLKKPLIRTRSGFIEVTWDQALDYVASRLREIQAKHGRDSVSVLASAKATNEENYLIQKLTRAALGTNNIDHCARLCHSSTVTGLVRAFGSGAMTNSVEDIEDADAILIIGSNTSEQHPLIARRVMRAVRRGASLIVADPRRIPLSAVAKVHLRQKPGTDIPLLNGLMSAILSEGLEDREFIAERTEGIERLREHLAKYTPLEAERITGVQEKDIRDAARIFAEANSACILFSMGITQHITGVNNVLSVANLALLTGNIGKPGTGVNPLRGQNNVQGACDVGALPDLLPGYRRVEDEAALRELEEAWHTALPRGSGLTLMEKVEGCGDKVRAMLVFGENPAMSDPDSTHVREQLGKLDLLVVSELFMSETAELADVVLPAACFAEKDGTFTATDRRIQRIRKAVEPPGEARSDLWMVCQIASRLGFEMSYDSASEVMDEIASVTPIYRGVSYRRLEDEDLRWPVLGADHPGTRILHTEKFTRGLGRFHIVEHRAASEEPDAEYPLTLTTGRIHNQWHTGTMTRRSPTLAGQGDEAFVEIHSEDARHYELTDGAFARVASRRGEIKLRVRVSPDAKRGVVFIPMHFAEASANVLTNTALDPEAKIPEYKACAVRIESI